MMQTRQKLHPRRYPRWMRKDSPARRRAPCIAWHCESCGVANRTIAYNVAGDIYIIYLHAAHVHQLDLEQPESIGGQALRCMCPTCHASYDAKYKELARQKRMHRFLLAQFIIRRMCSFETHLEVRNAGQQPA